MGIIYLVSELNNNSHLTVHRTYSGSFQLCHISLFILSFSLVWIYLIALLFKLYQFLLFVYLIYSKTVKTCINIMHSKCHRKSQYMSKCSFCISQLSRMIDCKACNINECVCFVQSPGSGSTSPQGAESSSRPLPPHEGSDSFESPSPASKEVGGYE